MSSSPLPLSRSLSYSEPSQKAEVFKDLVQTESIFLSFLDYVKNGTHSDAVMLQDVKHVLTGRNSLANFFSKFELYSHPLPEFGGMKSFSKECHKWLKAQMYPFLSINVVNSSSSAPASSGVATQPPPSAAAAPSSSSKTAPLVAATLSMYQQPPEMVDSVSSIVLPTPTNLPAHVAVAQQNVISKKRMTPNVKLPSPPPPSTLLYLTLAACLGCILHLRCLRVHG